MKSSAMIGALLALALVAGFASAVLGLGKPMAFVVLVVLVIPAVVLAVRADRDNGFTPPR